MISGLPYLAMTSSNALTQKLASGVLESGQDSTSRVAHETNRIENDEIRRVVEHERSDGVSPSFATDERRLVPLYAALGQDMKPNAKPKMDVTVLPQLLQGNGKTKTCDVWAPCRDDRRWLGNEPQGIVFNFERSRHGEDAEQTLDGFREPYRLIVTLVTTVLCVTTGTEVLLPSHT